MVNARSYPLRTLLALALTASLVACGGSQLAPGDVQFKLGETKFLMLESGALIVGKRQVGTVGEDGKITDSRKQLLAWVHDKGVRIKGGGNIPIKVDTDGTLYLPSSPQKQAGLRPMKRRVRPDGSIAGSRSSAGIEIEGPASDRNRRLILAVLLLAENSLFGEDPPSTEGGDEDGEDTAGEFADPDDDFEFNQ